MIHCPYCDQSENISDLGPDQLLFKRYKCLHCYRLFEESPLPFQAFAADDCKLTVFFPTGTSVWDADRWLAARGYDAVKFCHERRKQGIVFTAMTGVI